MLGLCGLFAPIVTPFTDDGDAVSEVRLARLVRHLVQGGIAGFVACTETGEFITTNAAERKQVLEILVREAHGLPVIAHCTRLGTSQSLDLCQHAGRHGAQAAIVMPPYYGVYSEEEIEQHIRRIVQHAGLPIIVVDPQHVVRTHIRDNLSSLPELHYAESLESAFRTRFAIDPSGVSSDEFSFEEAVVSPLVLIDPVAAVDVDADLHPLARLVAHHGRPRVAKAALNLREVEVGPPRSPVLPLTHAIGVELESLVRTR